MGIPDKIILQGEKITEIIPQKPPFVMIDKLLYCDDKMTKTGFMIKEDTIFCDNGVFCEPGLIENIAQTVAASSGYLYKDVEGDIPVGYIAAIKNLKIYFLPAVNTEIITETVIENEIMGFIIISGKVRCADKIAAECEMRIFQKK